MLVYYIARGTVAVCLAVIIITSPVSADELSLQQALNMAATGNPTIAEGRLSAQAARQSARGARALANPEILVAPSVVGKAGSDSAVLLSQPLELNGSRRVRGNVASHEASAAGFDADALRRNVMLQVSSSYWQVAQAQELVKLNQDNVHYLETVRVAVEKQRDVGAAPGAQLMKMELEVARARQELSQAQLELTQSKAELATLLSRPCDMDFVVSDPLTFSDSAPNRNALLISAMVRRPELASAQSQLLAARGQITAAKLLTVPDVALQARRETFYPNSNGGVALAVTLPLLDWGSARAAKQSAATFAQSREKQLEAVRNDVYLDVEQAVARVATTAQIVREYQGGILDKSEQLAAMAKKGYEMGANNYLELLEAQRTLRSTKSAYYSALAEHAKALARLEWAVGCPIQVRVQKS